MEKKELQEVYNEGLLAYLRRQRTLIESMVIAEAIRDCQGNKTKAARRLQISTRQISYKCKQYHLT